MGYFILILSTDFPNRSQPDDTQFYTGAKIASITSADRDGAWIIDIFSGVDLARPERPGRYPPLYSARFRRGLDYGRDRWTNTNTCPALVGVISALDGVFAPRFNPGHPFGMPPEEGRVPASTPPPLHATRYTIEGRAIQADGSVAQMSISSGAGTIAAFGKMAETRLAHCWPDPPPAQ